ncbi:ISSod13 [Klebsiella pneumoniae]|uniref:ISSod13 n=1 Tax=Klebsiella pneumoniae TaxID=573 RepID=A0A378F3W4_KLEPN|nr:ISSod13 [Klebsiella pneumoniae]
MIHTNNPSSNTKLACSIWQKNSVTFQKPVRSWACHAITFYRYQELAAEGGIDALINPKPPGSQPQNNPVTVSSGLS